MDDKRVPAHLSFDPSDRCTSAVVPRKYAVESLQERWILLLGLLLS